MTSAVTSLEILPFSGGGAAESGEIRRRPTGGARTWSTGPLGLGRPPRQVAQGTRRRPRALIGGYGRVWPGVEAPAADAPGSPASEQIRWVQFVLNGVMGTNLPNDGCISPDLRSTLRAFQAQQGLPVSGFIGPDTIDALKHISGSQPLAELAGEEYDISHADVMKLDNALKIGPLSLTRNRIATVPEVPGLYRITWSGGNYYGKSETNLRKRLRQHINDVEQLGFTTSPDHKFTYAPMPRSKPDRVKSAEKKVTALHYNEPGNMNKRIGELEVLEAN